MAGITEQLEELLAMVSCRGKTALVTNASRVPGEAAALVLANAGAQVLVHDDRSTVKVEAIVKKIRAAGGVARAIAADISMAEGPQQLAHQTRGIVGDRLDILVFNPGIPSAQSAAEATAQASDAQFAVSARAPFFLVQQLLPILNRGSSIVFTHSDAEAPDASTEDAILHLTKHFAVLLEPRGIRVNAVHVQGSHIARPLASRAPRNGRLGVIRSVGETIAFLASNAANRITGQTLQAHLPKMYRPRRAAGAATNRS